MKQPTDQIRQP